MYWQKDMETLPRPELEALQVCKLKAAVARAMRSPFYARAYGALGLGPDSIRTIDDIRRFPFTTKEDLRANYPYGFVAEERDNLVRLHCSSGTTGNPTVIFHTKHDLEAWSNLIARSLYATGARRSDVFQNICGYGLFTGGLGFQYGAERLGALTIPAGAGNSQRQIKLMRDFGTTVVHAIPSYLVRLHDVFTEAGLDPARDTRLRILVIGAEPHTEENRRKIERLFGCKAFNSYGLSEMNGPGVAFECERQTGLHVWEDAFVVELVDPETLAPVKEGEQGELVMTTLDREAMPLIRYRVRDLTAWIPGDCPCGRTHRRLARITGRSDDMFIIKGCNVFPMQIEGVLMRFAEIGHDYRIVLETRNGVDEMRIEVEVSPEGFSDNFGELERLVHRIVAAVRDEVLVSPKVRLVEHGTLPKSEGKAVRVQDLRCK